MGLCDIRICQVQRDVSHVRHCHVQHCLAMSRCNKLSDHSKVDRCLTAVWKSVFHRCLWYNLKLLTDSDQNFADGRQIWSKNIKTIIEKEKLWRKDFMKWSDLHLCKILNTFAYYIRSCMEMKETRIDAWNHIQSQKSYSKDVCVYSLECCVTDTSYCIPGRHCVILHSSCYYK